MRNAVHRMIKCQQGFTLMEMVITIILLGIVGVMSVQMILPIISGYNDARTTDQLYNEAKFAIERIDRELRMAIPNTVRTVASDTGVQFGLLADAAYYSDSPASNSQIEVDATMGGAGGLTVGDQLSVYNTNPGNFYNSTRVYQVTAPPVANIVQLNRPLVPHSPSRRFYMLNTPVTFYHSGTQLLRSFGYGLGSVNYGTSGGDVLATKVQNATFTYSPGTLSRNAYLQINLTMSNGGLTLNYSHRIHIRNMP